MVDMTKCPGIQFIFCLQNNGNTVKSLNKFLKFKIVLDPHVERTVAAGTRTVRRWRLTLSGKDDISSRLCFFVFPFPTIGNIAVP